MKRINVVGSSGSGKSTFSKRLAMKLGVTYIEMDRLFWLPDWKELDDETFFDKVVDVTQQEFWEGTGNRESFRKAFLSKDSVIWWSVKNYRKNRKRYLKLKEDLKGSPIEFIHITSPKMAQDFINR